jgi:hypothetical protein
MTPSSRTLARGVCLAAIAALSLASPSSAKSLTFTFDKDNFDNPLDIDNVFFPLVPGTTFIYKAETPDGCEEDHFSVLAGNTPPGTKDITIDGETITVRVIQDLAYEDAECDGADPADLHEKTFDWHAQDDFGNVWYFGEETYNCQGEGNCVLGSGSWEAGKDIQDTGANAKPGVFMLAEPTTGDSYRQEEYIGFAEDFGKIMGKNATVRLRREDAYPPGEFDGCLVTKEWNALDPGSVEQKYYCPEIGLVLVTEASGGKTVRFELTSITPAAARTSEDAFTFRVPKR